MMQGVLARGTAHSIADLAPYVAGKTGTSDDENDAWFVGFTNEVTVAVRIGYDERQATHARRRRDRRRCRSADLRACHSRGVE
jgi:membrane carboxypeptidase/penicillin-binding protein